jgi:hypothetical protein
MNRFERLTLPCTILRNEKLSVLCRSPGAVRVVDGMPVGYYRETSNAYGIHIGVLENMHFQDPEGDGRIT